MIDPHPSTLPDTSPEAAPPPPDPFAALIERWFVTYNPVYLSSAALVLATEARRKELSLLGYLRQSTWFACAMTRSFVHEAYSR